MSNQNAKRLLYAVVISVLFHFSISAGLLLFKEQPPRTSVIELDVRDFRDEKQRVVDQDERPINDEIPQNAQFLSRHNQTVKKQTVAKERGEFKNSAAKFKGERGAKRSTSLTDLLPSIGPSQQRRVTETTPAQKKQADPGAEVSQTLDYIKELDNGLETQLSTKEFVYFTYFSRIRTQLNQYWSPKIREKIRKIYSEGRSIASSEDRITRCLVTLDTAGKLLRVQIIGNSGIVELDEAAVESFRSAAPFPNPPAGMVDDDKTIKIRWDFILEA